MPSFRTAAALAFAAVPLAALAHHGWSSFDTAKVLDYTAPVVTSQWSNPHGTVTMTRDGRTLTIELAPVSRMTARGLTEADIAPGRTLRVFAYESTRVPNTFRAEWVEAAGKRVELR